MGVIRSFSLLWLLKISHPQLLSNSKIDLYRSRRYLATCCVEIDSTLVRFSTNHKPLLYPWMCIYTSSEGIFDNANSKVPCGFEGKNQLPGRWNNICDEFHYSRQPMQQYYSLRRRSETLANIITLPTIPMHPQFYTACPTNDGATEASTAVFRPFLNPSKWLIFQNLSNTATQIVARNWTNARTRWANSLLKFYMDVDWVLWRVGSRVRNNDKSSGRNWK